MLTTNSKLRKDKIVAFNLPAIKTCPGAGECKRYCYARKGRYVFPVVKAAHARNYEAALKPTFVDAMDQALCRSRAKYVRLHTSGDFFSQAYLDMWVSIMRNHPEKRFYCYSKSLHLDWSCADALSNFARTQSVGGKYDREIRSDISRTYVVPMANKTEFDQSDMKAALAMFNGHNVILKRR